MDSSKQICYNGKYYLDELTLWGASNRAFRYGDSLFETIHAQNSQIQFLNEHFQRLIRGMKTIGMKIPRDFTVKKIERESIHLLNKNKIFGGARIRLSVFRNKGGLYTPTDNTISYLIEATPLKSQGYTINKKGLSIGIYTRIRKPINILSPFKTGSALPFVMAGLYRQEKNWDDCILLNERGNLVEGLSSNLFLVKEDILMTPSLDSGCVAGIMREQVIEAALRKSITVYDDCRLTPNDLEDAHEIFLTNAISGIRWVVAYQERRFFNRISKQLTDELNSTL